MDKTLYDLIGVPSHASSDEIEAACIARAKKLEAKENVSAEATLKFSELEGAYEVLGNPIKRANYDNSLIAATTTKPTRHFPRSYIYAVLIALAVLLGGGYAYHSHMQEVRDEARGQYLARIIGPYMLWLESESKGQTKDKLIELTYLIEAEARADERLNNEDRVDIALAGNQAREVVSGFAEALADKIGDRMLPQLRASCLSDLKLFGDAKACMALKDECYKLQKAGVTRSIPACEPLF
jgi:curved DNA-binding protein CbpA